MAARQQRVELPETVAKYLGRLAPDPRFHGDVIDRLQTAPCSIRAFSSIHLRLSLSGFTAFDDDGILRDSMDLLVRKAAEAGSRWYSLIREGKEAVITNHAKKLADAAGFLYDAMAGIKVWSEELGAGSKSLRLLLDRIEGSGFVEIGFSPENFGHDSDQSFIGELGRLCNLAREVESDDLIPPDPAYFSAAQSGYFNPIQAFVASLDTYISEHIGGGEIENQAFPAGFKLSDTEMAGLAWAATDQGDLSPVINTRAAKDSRAERVRKIRAARER